MTCCLIIYDLLERNNIIKYALFSFLICNLVENLLFVDVALDMESDSGNKLPVLQTASALTVSLFICLSATCLTKFFGIQGGTLPSITAIVVVLATALPMYFGYLAPAGDTIAVVLMQVIVISQVYLV